MIDILDAYCEFNISPIQNLIRPRVIYFLRAIQNCKHF